MKKLLLITLLFIQSAIFAQSSNQGFLNIVTGEPEAKIYVDGEYVGDDFIKKMPLDEGQHYVRIEYNGKLMYAKMVTIYPDRLQTITSENFVDIKTKTANRGAIERESRRLGETKGNIGIGFIWGDNYPAKGMSLKWFSPIGIGLQFSAIGSIEIDDKDTSEIGLRAIIPIGNKIFSNNNLTGYSTLGFMQSDVDNESINYLGGSVGVEFAFGDPLYFNAEVGISNPISDSDDGLQMSWSTGLHFYF